jgi:hypothetical protein
MSQDKKELVRNMMREASVPRSVWATTLPHLNRDDLRQIINDRALEVEDVNGFRGIFFKSILNSDRQIFLAFAKECVLAGYTVKVLNLPILLEWIEEESYREVVARLRHTDLVFIQDFIEDVPSPVDTKTAGFLRALVKELLDSFVGVCVMVDAKNKDVNWCGQNLRAELYERNIIVE